MSPRSLLQANTLATFTAWALAAGCAAFWGLRIVGQAPVAQLAPPPPPAYTAPDASAIAMVLGARVAGGSGAATPLAPPPASSRFALHGVLQQPGGGVALISIDGKPAKHYRVGAEVDSGFVLLRLGARSARLGTAADGAGAFTLELPTPSVLVSQSASPALAQRPPAPGSPPAALAQTPPPGNALSATDGTNAVAGAVATPTGGAVAAPGTTEPAIVMGREAARSGAFGRAARAATAATSGTSP